MADKPSPEITTDILIADAMLRLTALENLLLKKGVFTKLELEEMTREITERVSKAILQKVQLSNSLDQFISSLRGEKPAPKN